MDSPSDPVADDELYSGRKLKIRRSPSSRKVCAGLSAKTSSSFHGRSRTTINQQPLIIHTFDPEIIVTEPDEFMWVVQRLTGSLDTRRLLRASKPKRKEVQAPMQVQDVQLVQQSNYCSLMKEDAQICTGAALIMMANDSNTAVMDHPSSPLSSNSSDLSSNYCVNPLVLQVSSDTNYQLNFKISPPSSSNYHSNHSNKYPLPPISCNYNPLPLINHSMNPYTLTIDPNPSLLPPNPSNPSALTINSNPSPLSLNPSNPTTITINNNHSPSFPSPSCPLIINPNPSPLSANPNNFTDNNDLPSPLSCNSGITSDMASPISSIIKPGEQRENKRGQPGSPSSQATSGLTTSSEECDTDLSIESCASPMQELIFSPKQGSYNDNMEYADEEESNFFLFSFDSYYGSHAGQDGGLLL